MRQQPDASRVVIPESPIEAQVFHLHRAVCETGRTIRDADVIPMLYSKSTLRTTHCVCRLASDPGSLIHFPYRGDGIRTMPPVLLIESDSSIRRLLRLILTRAGYRVAEVRDGRSALQWLQGRCEPAVVLLTTAMSTKTIEEVVSAATDAIAGQPHACVLLTAMPESLPQALRPVLATHRIPVVGPPFAVADVLEAVGGAARRAHEPADTVVTEPTDSRDGND